MDQIAAHIARVSPGEVQDVLARHRPTFYGSMEDLGVGILKFLAEGPTPDRIQEVRRLITTQISRWSSTSPILRHSLRKPPGQAVDPELVKALLEKRPAGADIPALVFNDYYKHTVGGSAYRDRLEMLIEAVQDTVSSRAAGAKSVRILCLHVSGAGEFLTLAQDPTFAEIAEVTCIDSRSVALRDTRRVLQGRLQKRCLFVHEDALRYARRPDRSSQPFDIIYGIGVFEHLNMERAIQLAQDCRTLLAPGGVLYAGSVTVNIPAAEQVLRAWLTGSELQYRDETSWRQIFTQAGFAASALRFAYERYKANVLIRAEKDEEASLNGHRSAHKSVLRYFNPESLISTATVLPWCVVLNSLSAAATLAPDENPAKMPSSRASRRAVWTASSSLTFK